MTVSLVGSNSARTSAKPEQLDGGEEPPDNRSVEHRLTALEVRLDTVLPTLATKADIGELRADMAKNHSDISRWMLATMLTVFSVLVVGFGGLGVTFYKALSDAGRAPPAAAIAPTPTVIYVSPPVQVAAPSPAASR